MSHFVQLCCRPHVIRKSCENVFLRDFLHRNYQKTFVNVFNNNLRRGCYATSTSSVITLLKSSSKREASLPPLQSLRRWQSSSSSTSQILSQKPDTNSVQPRNNLNIIKLRSWAFSVELFGNLIIRTSLSVRVTPINPHEYPAADRAFIHLMLKSRAAETKSGLKDFLQGDEVGLWQRFVRGDVLHQDATIDVSGDVVEKEMASLEDAELLWLIEVPMSYGEGLSVGKLQETHWCVLLVVELRFVPLQRR